MMKKLLVAIVSLSLLLIPMQVFAFEVGLQSTESISADENVTPNIMVTREKTVVKTYSEFSSIPESISYSEFDMGVWWYGVLFLESSENNGTYWYATYTGLIQGNI